MSGARWFLICFAAATAVVLGGSAAFNVIVDPYGYFDSPLTEGFNARKPAALSNDRILKTSAARSSGIDCVTAGSSRIGEGIPLDHQYFAHCKRAYDLSLAGSTATEMAAVVGMAARHNRLKKVVIGLDMFMFNATRVEMRGSRAALYSDTLYSRLKIGAEQLFSLDGVADSWTTVQTQASPAFHRPDGTTDEAFLRADEGQREILPRFLRCSRGYIFHYLPPPRYGHIPRVGGIDTYGVLEGLLVDLHRQGVEVVLFVPPTHAWDSELIDALGLWHAWEDFKRSTFEANLDAAARTDSQPYPFWDFSSYSALTAEPLKGEGGRQSMQFHWDCSHFKPALGRLVLDQFATPQPDSSVGVRLEDVGALEGQLQVVRQGRDAFHRDRQREVRQVELIVDCFAPPPLKARLGRVGPSLKTCRALREATR